MLEPFVSKGTSLVKAKKLFLYGSGWFHPFTQIGGLAIRNGTHVLGSNFQLGYV